MFGALVKYVRVENLTEHAVLPVPNGMFIFDAKRCLNFIKNIYKIFFLMRKEPENVVYFYNKYIYIYINSIKGNRTLIVYLL